MNFNWEKTKTYLENMVKYLPLISIGLVFIGLLRLKIYYFVFNIDITSFIDVSEIITPFFTDILQLLLFVLITFPIFYISDNVKKSDSWLKKTRIIFINSLEIMALGLVIRHLMDLSFFLPLYILLIVFIVVSKFMNKAISEFYYIIGFVVLSFAITGVFKPWNDARNLISKRHLRLTSVEFNDGFKIKPFKNEFVVGNTHSYLFTYNSVTKNSHIYPIGEAKYIKINDYPTLIIYPDSSFYSAPDYQGLERDSMYVDSNQIKHKLIRIESK